MREHYGPPLLLFGVLFPGKQAVLVDRPVEAEFLKDSQGVGERVVGRKSVLGHIHQLDRPPPATATPPEQLAGDVRTRPAVVASRHYLFGCPIAADVDPENV